LFGASAGGPYVAACAYKLPERIPKAAIVSGVSPMNRKGFYDRMHATWRATFLMSKLLPAWLLRPLLWIHTRRVLKNQDKAVTDYGSVLSDFDKKILSRSEIKEQFITNHAEAIRHGVKGWVHESKVLVSPWGFNPEDITVPMHLWYWKDDLITPLQMGKYLDSKIPNTYAHFLQDGGHFSFIDYWEEIIKTLLTV
jgi:pimeloyl-ACP methyl ester carboxylesterase